MRAVLCLAVGVLAVGCADLLVERQIVIGPGGQVSATQEEATTKERARLQQVNRDHDHRVAVMVQAAAERAERDAAAKRAAAVKATVKAQAAAPAPAAEPDEPEKPPKRYEVSALIRRFISNHDAALAELENKVVEVSGTVVGVEDGSVGMAGPGKKYFLNCDLAEDVDPKDVARLARGRRATLRGEVSEYRRHDWRKRFQEWLVLTECRVKR